MKRYSNALRKSTTPVAPPPSVFITRVYRNKAAFTLAEVLITLAIIGIVAALTIPILVSKIQNNVLISQFKKSYAVLNQALTATTYEHGTEYKCYAKSIAWGINNYFDLSECDEFFETFVKHIDYIKVENEKPGNKWWLYSSQTDVIANGGNTTNPACTFTQNRPTKYYLKDGSTIYRNGIHYIILDVNGDKGPNKWGYDVFYLTPVKTREYNAVRINEGVCAIWEKGGKRTANIINNTDEVSNLWFPE